MWVAFTGKVFKGQRSQLKVIASPNARLRRRLTFWQYMASTLTCLMLQTRMNLCARLLESADDFDWRLFVITGWQLRAVGEERVVDVDGVVLHHAVLHRLHTNRVQNQMAISFNRDSNPKTIRFEHYTIRFIALLQSLKLRNFSLHDLLRPFDVCPHGTFCFASFPFDARSIMAETVERDVPTKSIPAIWS